MKDNPLESLGQILPVIIVLVSFIGFIDAVAAFIINGNLAEQISRVKDDLFDGVVEGFTLGTVRNIFFGVESKFVSALLLVELIVLIISYFQTENKVKKIIISICLGLCSMLIIATLAIVKKEGISIYEPQLMVKFILLGSNFPQPTDVINKLIMFVAFIIILIITLIILILISKHRWMLKHSFIALIISYGIFPLIVLLIENLIPMLLGLFLLCYIIGGLFTIIQQVFMKDKEEDLRYRKDELKREQRKYEYNIHNAESKFKRAKERWSFSICRINAERRQTVCG